MSKKEVTSHNISLTTAGFISILIAVGGYVGGENHASANQGKQLSELVQQAQRAAANPTSTTVGQQGK